VESLRPVPRTLALRSVEFVEGVGRVGTSPENRRLRNEVVGGGRTGVVPVAPVNDVVATDRYHVTAPRRDASRRLQGDVRTGDGGSHVVSPRGAYPGCAARDRG
jgi:hypothetical protein